MKCFLLDYIDDFDDEEDNGVVEDVDEDELEDEEELIDIDFVFVVNLFCIKLMVNNFGI